MVTAAPFPPHRVLWPQGYLFSWDPGLGPWHLLYSALWGVHWVGPSAGVHMLPLRTLFSFPTPSSLMTDRVCVTLTRAKSCDFSGPNNLSLALGHNLVIFIPQG